MELEKKNSLILDKLDKAIQVKYKIESGLESEEANHYHHFGGDH